MNPIVKFLMKANQKTNKFLAPKPEEVKSALINTLEYIENLGTNTDIWICGGVLLGYARHGALLEHDTDIDFHYWKKDSNATIKFINDLTSKKNFSYSKNYKNNDGQITQHVIKYKKTTIDFFMAEEIDDKIEWYSYTTKHWNRPSRQFLNQAPYMGLEKFNFYGHKALKPRNHEIYLESLYGDWKTPQKDYTYYIDSKAIISKSPWRE